MQCLICGKAVKGQNANKEICASHYQAFKNSGLSYKVFIDHEVYNIELPPKNSFAHPHTNTKYILEDDWIFECTGCSKEWRIRGVCSLIVLLKYYNMMGARKGVKHMTPCDLCQKTAHLK